MIETVNINLTIGLFDGHALHMVGGLFYFRWVNRVITEALTTFDIVVGFCVAIFLQ